MRVVLDTNVIIDAMAEREPFYIEAQEFLYVFNVNPGLGQQGGISN